MLVASPSLYVLVLLIVPVGLIGLYSVNLATNEFGVPAEFSTANWHSFLFGADNPFRDRFIRSLLVTLAVSVAAVIGAYPLAYFLAFVAGRHRYTILLAILAPFFTSYLLRVVAWQGILSNDGVINSLLWELGLRDRGNSISGLIYSNFSVGLVLFYAWVPFVALPIFVSLDNLDISLLEAASDLGASRFRTFWRITLPLSIPGVIAAFVFVFVPTIGEFVTPLLVGGPSGYMYGNAIQDVFTRGTDWQTGSVLAMFLLVVVAGLMALFGRYVRVRSVAA
jgi:spermidine/putrescine transport system permease protein